jgi:polyvinyl alcohol dehydrogenase (cytochrome)
MVGWIWLLALSAGTAWAGSPCSRTVEPLALDSGDWNGWGADAGNSRYQSQPGFSAAEVGRLKLKWAFGMPGESTAFAEPAVVGGHVFIGSGMGTVYSIDAASGCVNWTYRAEAGVRTAITVRNLGSRKWAVFFGDLAANVYAVDAEAGGLIWKKRMDAHPAARITGSPVWAAGRLYVTVSSTEESLAHRADYSCCTFRGSVVALDASTGRTIWKSYTIPDPPMPYGISKAGTTLQGPAGAAVWSAPTIDIDRNRLYAATGNSYTGVNASTSDAILAFELDSGKMVWSRQMEPKDNYIVGCPFHPNCPESSGPDYDFGASPLLLRLGDGSSVLVAAQKSGMVYALFADRQGSVAWQRRLGEGGTLGGIMWGPAADASQVYVAVSDRLLGKAGRAGLYALDLKTGTEAWSKPAPEASGNPAQSAAITAMPGVVFSGAANGHFRAYSTDNGEIVWDFDTHRPFQTVNNIPAKGGSIDGPGPVIAHGMVFTNSGYALFGGNEGNVLLAFSVDGK